MKIICINNPHTDWEITPGKIYELKDHDSVPRRKEDRNSKSHVHQRGLLFKIHKQQSHPF